MIISKPVETIIHVNAKDKSLCSFQCPMVGHLSQCILGGKFTGRNIVKYGTLIGHFKRTSFCIESFEELK